MKRTKEQLAAYDTLHAAISDLLTLVYPDSVDSMLVEWVVCHASVMIQDDATRYGYIVPAEATMAHHHLTGLLAHTLRGIENAGEEEDED